jgi:hypothetical protein
VAVDDLVALYLLADFGDAARGDADVGALELPGADVDETVFENQLGQAPARVAMSATTPLGISSFATWRGKPSRLRTLPVALTTATSAT